MDALDVFYRVRHEWPEFEALMSELRFVFATGSHMEALAAVHSQCSYVMRHYGRRPAGRDETGGMIGAVTTAAEAMALCEQYNPQMLITTDQLEDEDGFTLVEQAHKRWPQLPILLVLKQLSTPRLRQALAAGSQGIITDKLFMEGHVYAALKALLKGNRYHDPKLAALLKKEHYGWDPQLTNQQLKILELVVAGRTDREIAAELTIPFDTVRNHLKLTYRELGASNRTQAGITSIRLGLVKSKLYESSAPPNILSDATALLTEKDDKV
jgi:DNA-binding NarL/FixJ family response regulator